MMNLLLVAYNGMQVFDALFKDLKMQGCAIITEPDLITAIQLTQKKHFDVIVIKARMEDLQVDRAIPVLKTLDPKSKIIIHTDNNSRIFEARIRKEQIFYYHIDSFGFEDLKLAICSALGCGQSVTGSESNAIGYKKLENTTRH